MALEARDAGRAAIYYALVESAKLCGIDPQAYIRTAAVYALEHPGGFMLPTEYPK